jgi:hypothetical protein
VKRGDESALFGSCLNCISGAMLSAKDKTNTPQNYTAATFTLTSINWLNLPVFSDKDVKIVGTSDPPSIGQ